jgi:two-component system OmpR family sensor kinase
MRSWTLRRRLVALVVGLVVVVAGAMGAVSTLALRGSMVGRLDDDLRASSGRAVAAEDLGGPDALPGGADGGRFPVGPPPGLDVRGQRAGTVSLTVRDGAVSSGRIDDAGGVARLDDAQVDVLAAVEPGAAPVTRALPGLGRYRVLAATTAAGDLVVTGIATTEVDRTVRDYLVVETLVALVGVLVAGVAGRAVVRRELRPLERVATTATRVSKVPLATGEVRPVERVPAADTDPRTEVGQVGAALNRLLDHVETSLAARHASETQVRQFVADASHELRTPLASIRGYAELVRRLRAEVPDDVVRAMGRVEAESRRMTRLVEDMLLLARLDAGRELERTDVDLGMLAADAVPDARAAGPDHRWRLDLPPLADDGEDGAPAAVVTGDAPRLHQVLVNLLANARVHTPPGTTVVTSVRRDGDVVVLAVTDDGPGVAPALVPHLFQRFSRGDAARSPGSGSTGLGLAIADAVVRAHDGTIEVSSRPGATRFVVRLPTAAG